MSVRRTEIIIAKNCKYKFLHKIPRKYSWVFFMRNTPARLSIIWLLSRQTKAHEEETIFEHVIQDTRVNLSTIYRALKDLEWADKVHAIMCRWKRYWYYCQCSSHEHISVDFCLNCLIVSEQNSSCDTRHEALVSDKRERIVLSCTHCIQNK